MIQQFHFWVYIQKKWNHSAEEIYVPLCSLLHSALFTIAKTWNQHEYLLMDEYIYTCVCIYIYWILFSHKHKGNPFIFDDMDGASGHYAKWNKSDKGRQILDDLTSIWNLKTWNSLKQKVEWWLPGANGLGKWADVG